MLLSPELWPDQLCRGHQQFTLGVISFYFFRQRQVTIDDQLLIFREHQPFQLARNYEEDPHQETVTDDGPMRNNCIIKWRLIWKINGTKLIKTKILQWSLLVRHQQYLRDTIQLQTLVGNLVVTFFNLCLHKNTSKTTNFVMTDMIRCPFSHTSVQSMGKRNNSQIIRLFDWIE